VTHKYVTNHTSATAVCVGKRHNQITNI